MAATQLHSPLDVAVYQLNCLVAIQSLVILYPYTDQRLDMIKAMVRQVKVQMPQIEANGDVLVADETSSILAHTGLLGVYAKAAAHESKQGALVEIVGMDSCSIQRALVGFDAYLAHPENYRLDQSSKISSARVR